MINNKALLSKKEFIKSTSLIAMPDISLDPEEADKFIDYIVEQSFWNKNARIVKMSKNEKNIRYMGYDTTKRFLKPASTFASSDYVKTFSEGKMTLSSKKLRGAVVIYDDDLEDNIEGQAFADHLMKIIATRVANELDEIYYVSNTTSGYTTTDARSLFNGFRYHLLHGDPSDSGTLPNAATELDASSTGDFTNAGKIAEYSTGTTLWEFKFAKMLSKLPSKYKVKGLGNLRFYCNDIVASDFTEALSQRGTVLGDNAILGKAPLNFGTVPLATIPLLPTTFGTGSAGTETYNDGTATDDYKYTDVILTNKDNFIIGLHRSLKLESERKPADEASYVYYTIRMDMKVENPEAAVILHDLTHG